MRKLFILAPNDRFNYGDLLFPHILTAHFGDMVDEIIYCSTSSADLRNKGGHKVSSFHSLYRVSPQDENYLIVAGGECLCCNWWIIFFVRKRFEILFRLLWKVLRFRKLKPERRWYLFNNIFRKVIGGKTYYPFTIGKNELSHFKGVYYNSLGGSGLANEMFILHDKQAQKILKSVDYIAVRDEKTGHCLDAIDVPNTVTADSAILMSDVFTEELLASKISPYPRTFQGKKYLFVQGNRADLKKNLQEISLQLAKLYSQTGLEICLCPIGTALGHNDDIGLAMLQRELQKLNIPSTLITRPSIYDIMWLIKHSELYIGTSLHGVITAMSFGVPYCSFIVEKVRQYISTWGDSKCFAPTIDQLYDTAQYALSQAPTDVTAQKESILQSFANIKSLMAQRN
ncbi:MAG: polysaccharide pyruvyl transferase family protein [Coprobacter sp.]|nr:polysaccharide pyruvyl transferase family protein [Coprobacter sp.]